MILLDRVNVFVRMQLMVCVCQHLLIHQTPQTGYLANGVSINDTYLYWALLENQSTLGIVTYWP